MPASTIAELPGKLAVACHDAGAANLVLAWVADSGRTDLLPVMEGPARTLWTRRFPDVPVVPLETALVEAAALLSGSGWGSDLEHRARLFARERRLPNVAAVDHWVNYRMRFDRSGRTALPDAIWVADAWAKATAEQAFPGLPVFELPNLYLRDELARIPAIDAEAPDRLLYLLEPARSDWDRGVPGEFQALDYLLANLGVLGLSSATPIRLRPHPSDSEGKYDSWLERHHRYDVSLDRSGGLAEAIGAASWVVGCNTAALPLALAAGRRTVCTLPPWAPACVLPHSGLVHLKDEVARLARD